ncbi:hypothetical protein PULV_b0183 [Pseudoalteromonas ulvae UL12]|uniref:Uncharacterized protein n=1 Tax=Pseudoalteromonas ulvae TaxID=107327 RepID=A0A244CR38_PSEDV|nr:hypothetical protein [Pseudoalteromonas ulvae]MBE0365579.1 hypothetical protein [Pseudoalteromonas ulvae UL12]OUL57946.1 hypothetical protein B1199_06165 [Pseudoalteromonas ulvae]
MQSQLSTQLQAHQQRLLDWQQLMQTANRAFIEQHYEQALATYQSAELASANQMSMLLSQPLDESSIDTFAHCAAAWVVTMHNIADCLNAQKNTEHSIQQLYHAYEAMMRLTLHRNTDIAEIARRQSRRCYQQWLLHGGNQAKASSFPAPNMHTVLH